MKIFFWAFSTVLSFPAAVWAALCVENNTLKCDNLGYTESSCPYGGIACPFDVSRRYCAEWTCEDGRYKNKAGINDDCLEVEYKDISCLDCVPAVCEIGSVYYADGTCGFAQNYDGSKIPVGIVFEANTEGNHGKIVNLNFLTLSDVDYSFNPLDPYGGNVTQMSWGLHGTDVINLTNYSTAELRNNGLKNRDEQLFNGKPNTALMAATKPTYSRCTDGTFAPGTQNYARYCYPTAALAALAFYPPGVAEDDPAVGAGNWYLPTYAELLSLRGYDFDTLTSKTDTRNAVNKALNILISKGVNASALTNSSLAGNWFYINSTEITSTNYISHDISGGYLIQYNKFGISNVRVVLRF